MAEIFINLKRFDVPVAAGGICQQDDPQDWIASVINATVGLGLGKLDGTTVTYLLPESLLAKAIDTLAAHPADATAGIAIGAQTVFREDVQKGGNFGAFTSSPTVSGVHSTSGDGPVGTLTCRAMPRLSS